MADRLDDLAAKADEIAKQVNAIHGSVTLDLSTNGWTPASGGGSGSTRHAFRASDRSRDAALFLRARYAVEPS